MNKITDAEINKIAADAGIPFAVLRAIVAVESSGRGFTPDGKLVIRFEPQQFKRTVAKSISSATSDWNTLTRDDQAAQWAMFDDAYSLDREAAMLSTSYGMMQVMGFNYKLCGFTNPLALVEFAEASEANQVILGVRFITKNLALKKACINKDWPTIAYYYNGAGYAKGGYDKKLQAAYDKVKPSILKQGAQGREVMALHVLLNKHVPFSTVGLDLAIFSKTTDTLVRAFQEKASLKVDGVVGEATWNELMK